MLTPRRSTSKPVDTDVKAAHGPDEGWITWMRTGIKKANWVLIFFDDVYRRRFEGDEQPSKGLGGTYEGAIIAAEHLRRSTINKKFVPLLPDGASTEVIPDEFFPYNHYYIPRQSNELALKLKRPQEPDRNPVPFSMRELSPLEKERRCSLWRLAYSFLRLDQLSSGGWGKSLPQWMEAIWEGDAGSINRSPEMRRAGGTDFTCSAFYNYVYFIERFLVGEKFASFSRENPVPGEVFDSLRARIDHDLGMGTGIQGRTVLAKVNLRHTAMGMISLILCGKPASFGVIGREEMRLTASYLNNNLAHWQKDKSHVFAMFAALVKLAELLGSKEGADEFAGENAADREQLVSNIKSVLPKIQQELGNFLEYEPLPKKTQTRTKLTARPFFPPYGQFWRMERSGFLMYLPLLILKDGGKFVDQVEKDEILKERFFHCFDELLEDIQIPFDWANPDRGLVKHHRRAGNTESPRDWGLTAELAALLKKAAIQELMLNHSGYSEKTLIDYRETLETALITTFDAFHKRPDIFKFTQSLSFSHYLDLLRDGEIRSEDLITLDKSIDALLEEGVMEKSLDAFVTNQIAKTNLISTKTSVNAAAIRDLLLSKLQSGEHTPDDKICSAMKWNRLNKDTIHFYDGVGGKRYAERYKNDPVTDFISHLDYMFKGKSLCGMKALDIACGPGQYAKLLKKRGFDVDLYDASVQMLELAAKSIGKRSIPKPRDYYCLADTCANEQYDLVFASAMMVHVPLRFASSIYEQFYRILRPDGVLFVNFKIGDHSLIALDGRFFQYYRDRETPLDMLKTAGFKIESIFELWNDRTLNNLPRDIRWANFYFIKPRVSGRH